MTDHKISGEYIYENMLLDAAVRRESVDMIRDLDCVDGDILVASYPKTGTTWMEEITWLVTNDADVERAKSMRLTDRMLFLEFKQSYHGGKSGVELLVTKPRPAIMKTHMTGNILAKAVDAGKVKVIVTIRNPKDTLVSLYHFYRMNSGLGNFAGTWDDFFELVKTKHVLNGDYFDWYDSWLVHMQKPNVLFFHYEEMKADPAGVVNRLARYLGREVSPEQVTAIVAHTDFKNMKSNKMVNNEGDPDLKSEVSPFIRKGQVGDWKNYFSSEQSQYVDDIYKERLEKKGVTLRFE